MERSRFTGLIVLATVALTLRLLAVWWVGTAHPEGRPVAYEHGAIAANLLAGKGFSIWFLGTEGPTSQQAPFYPLALAGLYSLFGVESPTAHVAMQWLQCAVGTGIVLCLVWLAWSLLPEQPKVGWIAGWGAAVYPIHIYMVTHLQVVTWATFLLVLLLALAATRKWQTTWSGAIGLGIVCGLLLLVDPILALALPPAAVFYWLAARNRGQSLWQHGHLLRTISIAAVALAVVSPWLVRNYLVHREFVFIKSTFGYAFWQGNNPHSWGTDKIPKPTVRDVLADHDGTLAGYHKAMWEGRHETLYIDDVLLKPHGYREFSGLSEPQRSRLLGRRAWQFVREHPDQYASLCFNRLRYFLLFDETNPKTSSNIYRIGTVLWLVLATLGGFCVRSRWKQLWPTAVIFASVLLFHTLTITSVRFRIPVEPLTFLWAAYPWAFLWSQWWPEKSVVQEEAETEPNSAAGHALRGPHHRKARRSAPAARRY